MVEPDRRQFGGAGQDIVGQGRRQRLTRGVVQNFLEQRGADALRRAAVGLPFEDHRIHPAPAIFEDDVVEDLDFAGHRIDCDDRRVRRVGEYAGVDVRLVAFGDLQTERIDGIGQQVRP